MMMKEEKKNQSWCNGAMLKTAFRDALRKFDPRALSKNFVILVTAIGALTGAMGDVVNAYRALLVGAFGDPAKFAAAFQTGTPKAWATAFRPISETLVAATPLMFTGLAIAVSFRTSVFNIGGDGQFGVEVAGGRRCRVGGCWRGAGR